MKSPVAIFLSAMLASFCTQNAQSAELKKETASDFEHYIAVSESRIKSELSSGPFLFLDQFSETRRQQAYAQVRDGQVLIQQVNTKEEGRPIQVHHGLIHDWVGVLFIPNTSLSQTLAVVQDYNNHARIYKPDVRQSKLLGRNGDEFKVFLQFYKESLATVIINANFDISFEHVAPNRVVSHSYSTRIAEVQNYGKPDEHELPVDDAHGYLWRLYSYWRFEERDGGVYVQLESIGLSRGVPAIFAWLVNPLLRSIPRGTLSSLLNATRTAVVKAIART